MPTGALTKPIYLAFRKVCEMGGHGTGPPQDFSVYALRSQPQLRCPRAGINWLRHIAGVDRVFGPNSATEPVPSFTGLAFGYWLGIHNCQFG